MGGESSVHVEFTEPVTEGTAHAANHHNHRVVALEATSDTIFDGSLVADSGEWSLPLGPRTIASPSVGDLDGDGSLEIVVASYDGRVYAVGAGQ